MAPAWIGFFVCTVRLEIHYTHLDTGPHWSKLPEQDCVNTWLCGLGVSKASLGGAVCASVVHFQYFVV